MPSNQGCLSISAAVARLSGAYSSMGRRKLFKLCAYSQVNQSAMVRQQDRCLLSGLSCCKPSCTSIMLLHQHMLELYVSVQLESCS